MRLSNFNSSVFIRTIVIVLSLILILWQHTSIVIAQEMSEFDIFNIMNESPFYGDVCTPLSTGSETSSDGPAGGLQFPGLDEVAMANAINKYIEEKTPGSKMKGFGSYFVSSSKHSNVNPFLLVSIAEKESGIGNPDAGDGFNVRNANNAFGRSATSSQPHVSGSRLWYKWSSLKASIDHTAQENIENSSTGGDAAGYIRMVYSEQIDTNDLSTFMNRYAPPSENDTEKYIKSIRKSMKTMTNYTKNLDSETESEATDESEESITTTTSTKLPPDSQRVFDDALPAIEKLKPVYEHGAEATGIKWQYLAALHYREANNREGTSILAGEPLGSTNPDGISETGGSDAKANAVASAKHFINNAKSIYNVDITKDTSFEALQNAFLAYNRGYMYKLAKNHNPPGREYTADESPYVMSGYDSDHALPMKWPEHGSNSGSFWGEPIRGTDSRLGAMSILLGLGVGSGGNSGDTCAGGSTSTSSSSGCEEIGQLDNKFTFPLCVTKKDMQDGVQYGGSKWVWCFNKETNCHHDYAAADIHANINTKVIAAVGGTVVSLNNVSSCRSSSMNVPRMQIKADDGKFYYYTHLKPGSLKVKEGQKVSAGDELGEVGPAECAQGTGPHLHIHRGSRLTQCAGTPTCAQHSDYNANSIQPDLYKAFQKLPQE